MNTDQKIIRSGPADLDSVSEVEQSAFGQVRIANESTKLGLFVSPTSRRLPNWILMKANEITALTLLEQTFPGGRPTSSGNHIQWDKLFIRVKPLAARLHAASQ